MDKAEFVTIFPTFGQPDVACSTLTSVIDDSRSAGAKVLVHDCTTADQGRDAKWAMLRELAEGPGRGIVFLVLSDNMSVAHSRNMCLSLATQLYAPDYVCVLEDDHGYQPGFIATMTAAMREYYGKKAPNEMRFGLFTGCSSCYFPANRVAVAPGSPHRCPGIENHPFHIGGVNNCCRCAPASHWLTVLRGYDTDEYTISRYQTIGPNVRNYNQGFTTMLVEDGRLMFDVPRVGRGVTTDAVRLWDETYAASDPRSQFKGGPPPHPARRAWPVWPWREGA